MIGTEPRAIFNYLRSLPPTQHYIGPPVLRATEDPNKYAASKALQSG